MNTQGKGALALYAVVAIGLGAAGCGSSSTTEPQSPATARGCRETTGDDARNTARVAGQGIEEGAEVGVAGVKQAVKATGGFIADGKEGASREWNEGKAETKQEEAEGRTERSAANLPPCP